MGFNRSAQQPSQPQPQTAPTRPQRQQMQPGQRPTRPQGVGMRPQRPPQVDARVQALRNRPQMQRPEMGRTPDYQNRRAQRQQQMSQGPQPTADQLWRHRNPGMARAKDAIGGAENVQTPWMNEQGAIMQSGQRLSAEDLKGLGYRYQPYRAEEMTGHSGGDNYTGMTPAQRQMWTKAPAQGAGLAQALRKPGVRNEIGQGGGGN